VPSLASPPPPSSPGIQASAPSAGQQTQAGSPGATGAGATSAAVNGSAQGPGAKTATGTQPTSPSRGARSWIALGGRHQSATLAYRIRDAGAVRFTIKEIWPDCRRAGAFTVRGHAGINRLRFNGRIRGRKLPAGTYRIRARSRGRTVLKRIFVVGGGAASPSTCGEAAGGATALQSSGLGSVAPGSDSGKLASSVDKSAAGLSHGSGVLGARASTILPGSGGTELALLIVLSLAIFLLGLGALPREVVPNAAASALLARRRALIAIAGMGALAAFVVSYFVT
jgi:hypothetical protein